MPLPGQNDELGVGDANKTSSVVPLSRKRKRAPNELDQGAGSSKADRKSPDQPEDLELKPHQPVDPKLIPELPEPCVVFNAYGELITDEMVREERVLEAEAMQHEQQLILHVKAKKPTAEEDQVAQQKRLDTLKHLLDKSSHFAAYIKQVTEEAKEQEGSSIPEPSPSRKNKGKKTKGQRIKQLAKDKELLDVEDSGKARTSDAATAQPRSCITQPKLLVGTMRDYQLEGLQWLIGLIKGGVNGILADEMGLGKTIQVIALVCYLVEQGIKGPFLIVGPLSTLSNWMSEFQQFAPKLTTILYHGSSSERKNLHKKFTELNHLPEGRQGGVLPIIVTSYEIALKDLVPLQVIPWELLVIDEGHRIKNFQCKLNVELTKYRTQHRILLTGTPLQNSLSELWSLLNFLLPDIFSEFEVFQSWLDAAEFSEVDSNVKHTSEKILNDEAANQTLSILHQILHPFMLRRVKADVNLNLPPKKELLVFAPLTHLQRELYRGILHQTIYKPKATAEELETEKQRRTCTTSKKLYTFDQLSSKEFEEVYNASLRSPASSCTKGKSHDLGTSTGFVNRLNPTAPFLDLRKVVNHPYLVQYPVQPGTQEMRIDEDMVKSSGKMLVLDAMLQKLIQQGHKTLLFSQFTMMLDLLEDYLVMRDMPYCRLDGSRSIADRTENIKKFSTDPSLSVFLLSTRAGGLGINLTAADTVIIYDSDWNPQCDLQAQDRCHRIGQTRPVIIYRLTTDGTVDRYMVERATGKRRLEKLVIRKGRFHGHKNSTEESALTPQELLDLINSNDHVRSVQSNGSVFTDAELESLLDRSEFFSTKDVSKTSDLFAVVDPEPCNASETN